MIRQRNSLAIVQPQPPLSPFDRHRQESGERATLELAADMCKRAAEKSAKAASLLSTASALPDRREALREGLDGWKTALREASALLAEVIREMEP